MGERVASYPDIEMLANRIEEGSIKGVFGIIMFGLSSTKDNVFLEILPCKQEMWLNHNIY